MLNYSFIVPIINTGEQLCTQMVSIPEDVLPKRLMIIDNSCGRDNTIKMSIHKLLNRCAEFQKFKDVEIFIHTPMENLGCAASWNYGIKNLEFPWIIANSDLFFNDSFGVLEILRLLQNSDMCLACGLSLFGLTKKAIEKAGNFDENFYPAYNEDLDYVTRLSLMGGIITQFGANVRHEHSSSLKNDTRLSNVISKTHQINDIYYCKKWGSKNKFIQGNYGDHIYCDFEYPFNNIKNSPKDWELNIDLMKVKTKIFNDLMGV